MNQHKNVGLARRHPLIIQRNEKHLVRRCLTSLPQHLHNQKDPRYRGSPHGAGG